jgi:hypothetical protein
MFFLKQFFSPESDEGTISEKRSSFYHWRGAKDEFLTRGTALVFGQSLDDDNAKQIAKVLEAWEYEPQWKPLATLQNTLQNGILSVLQTELGKFSL